MQLCDVTTKSNWSLKSYLDGVVNKALGEFYLQFTIDYWIKFEFSFKHARILARSLRWKLQILNVKSTISQMVRIWSLMRLWTINGPHRTSRETQVEPRDAPHLFLIHLIFW